MAIILNTRENLYCLVAADDTGLSTVFMVVTIGKFAGGPCDWAHGGASIRDCHECISCYA